MGNKQLIHNLAREGKYKDISDYLSVHKINPDTRDSESITPLMIAAHAGHFRCCKVLMDKGADVNATDILDRTALHYAASSVRGYRTIALLCSKGSTVNKYDILLETPLHRSFRCERHKSTKRLIRWGADESAKNADGKTPLEAYSNYIANKLHDLTEAGKWKEIRDLFTTNTVNPDFKKDDVTPLMIAAYKGYFRCCKILIDNGADVQSTDCFGMPVLYYAAVSRKGYRTIPLLCSYGASPNKCVSSNICLFGPYLNKHAISNTPLHTSVRYERLESTKRLIRWGADNHAKNAYGRSPLEEIVEIYKGKPYSKNAARIVEYLRRKE